MSHLFGWAKRAAPLVLLLWILGILLPIEWPARLSTAYHTAFHTEFFAPWTHEATHLVLYAVLGVLLAWRLGQPAAIRPGAGAVFALVVLAVAVSQEGIQLLTLGRGPAAPEVLDVAVDIAGAASGALILVWAAKRSLRRATATGQDSLRA